MPLAIVDLSAAFTQAQLHVISDVWYNPPLNVPVPGSELRLIAQSAFSGSGMLGISLEWFVR